MPILIGQTAPRLESHDPVGIEQQDGGSLDVQASRQRIQRRFVDFVQAFGATDGMRQLQANRERGGSRRQRHDPVTYPVPRVNASASGRAERVRP